MIESYKHRKFKENELADKIILEVVDSYTELKELKKLCDFDVNDFASKHIELKNEKNKGRVLELKEKIRTLTSLILL